MTWRTIADRILRESDAGTLGTIEPIGPEGGANVPIGPIVPAAPDVALKAWKDGLSRLDPRKPAEGYTPAAWWNLCDDAAWLRENFGERAARDGWSAADLFGLWPDKPGWGGIADRLRGARSLVMTADRAHWRSWGQMERFNRGAYPELTPAWIIGDEPNSGIM